MKKLISLVTIFLLLSGCLGSPNEDNWGGFNGTEWPSGVPAADFDLINQDGEEVSLSDFENKVSEFDHIVFADIEHQKNISTNLLNIGKIINDDCRVIVISKSLIWHTFINWYKRISKKSGPLRNNYLPFSNLKQFVNLP